jgi:hypothetical protein
MTDKEPEKGSPDKVRDIGMSLGRDLGERLKAIDPELLVIVASGNPNAAKNLRAARVDSTLPESELTLAWDQSSWHNVFRDSSGWTDVFGQSPALQ